MLIEFRDGASSRAVLDLSSGECPAPLLLLTSTCVLAAYANRPHQLQGL